MPAFAARLRPPPLDEPATLLMGELVDEEVVAAGVEVTEDVSVVVADELLVDCRLDEEEDEDAFCWMVNL
jgi:hypothetical protein